MQAKIVETLSRDECLNWLALNDPEYDWDGLAGDLDTSALQEVIADNLYDFGEDHQSGDNHVLLNELSLKDPHRGRVRWQTR